MENNKDPHHIRNVAIIAHVDHGKTTLVDQFLRQTGIFRANQQVRDCYMDSDDIERERGITIFSKNCAIQYKNTKINLIDTPGHADFGGEVERIMRMADGVLLLVDAAEGPKPQTRFVLRKALEHDLTPIVVINKIDRTDSRANEVLNEVFDLFVALEASDDQLDFAHVYAAGRDGYAMLELEDERKDISPLLDVILKHVPPPTADLDKPLQMLVSSIQYNEYVGRIAIGKISAGSITKGSRLHRCNSAKHIEDANVTGLFVFAGAQQVDTEMLASGDIAAVAGFPDIEIGDTLVADETVPALEGVRVDPPTVTMSFTINSSPFAGQDGKYLTSRHLRTRLLRELRSNLALRIEETDSPDTFCVSGRGLLHLSVLIENMRRESYEISVSAPQVIFREENGQNLEPVENVSVEVSGNYVGKVIEILCSRRAKVEQMSTKQAISHIELTAPTRGMMGIQNQILTATCGEAIMYRSVAGYAPFMGEIQARTTGSMISQTQGECLSYALYNLQNRGRMFVDPGTLVYEGMVVGEHARDNDITVNPCKGKHLTNMRSKSSDEALRLTPVIPFTLEEALTFIREDEFIEITPKNIRIRKKHLKEHDRKRVHRMAKATRISDQ